MDWEKIQEIEAERPEPVQCYACGKWLEAGEDYWRLDSVDYCEECLDDLLSEAHMTVEEY